MQVLSKFGELAWFKLPTEVNPTYGYPQVPYMGWRYRAPREGLAHFLESAIGNLPTEVEWILDSSQRNWVLTPTRITRAAGGLANPAFSEAAHLINSQDREFCLKAQSDFHVIIQHLEQLEVPPV